MDTRLLSFLTVCQTMNYRKAAKVLNLTQPAITKQIQSLEQELGTKLFEYDGRVLHKTEGCSLLEQYAISLRYNYEELLLHLQKKRRTLLRIGATKTIGDYVLGPALIAYLSSEAHEISLVISNTSQLLTMLDQNELDFAIIEGAFSKTKYGHYLLRNEPFVGVCSPKHPLCGKRTTLSELLSETLIIREEGSGTRHILESRLALEGVQTGDFSRVLSISSFAVIKQLICADIGITFLYQSVITPEDDIGTFAVEGVTSPHELNVVFIKNSAGETYSHLFLDEMMGK